MKRLTPEGFELSVAPALPSRGRQRNYLRTFKPLTHSVRRGKDFT